MSSSATAAQLRVWGSKVVSPVINCTRRTNPRAVPLPSSVWAKNIPVTST
ncbi:hypothetical protein [Rhodococcus sp. As11]